MANNLPVPLHDHVMLKTINVSMLLLTICRDVPKTPKQNSFKGQRRAVTMAQPVIPLFYLILGNL